MSGPAKLTCEGHRPQITTRAPNAQIFHDRIMDEAGQDTRISVASRCSWRPPGAALVSFSASAGVRYSRVRRELLGAFCGIKFTL